MEVSWLVLVALQDIGQPGVIQQILSFLFMDKPETGTHFRLADYHSRGFERLLAES